MINTNIIPARNLQKSYKAIIEGVKHKKQPVVLTTNNEPQAAIVSLEDLAQLKLVKAKVANLEILRLGEESKEELANLPTDLRSQADEILYGKQD